MGASSSLRLLTRPGVVSCRSLSRSSTFATAALIKRAPSLLRPPPSVVFNRGFKDDSFSGSTTLGRRWIRPDASSPSEWEAPSFAFAFDIDGVLLHEAVPLPGASQTLKLLDYYHIPFILLTNGGGKFEVDRVKELNEKLHANMTTDNFCQSHTPFQELLPLYRDKTILVTGSDYEKCREIMEGYGFKSVVTPGDIFRAKPEVFPFETVDRPERFGKPLPKPMWEPPKKKGKHENEGVEGKVLLTEKGEGEGEEEEGEQEEKKLEDHLKIDAMFVLNDPRDWALDVQVFMDLLQSKEGYVGTYSEENNRGNWQGDGQPKLYFSNSDLIWAAKYHLPRVGQGAFQHALVGIWREITEGGRELERVSFGKPHRETYEYAEEMLVRHRGEWLRSKGYGDVEGGLKRVYMVGDNPESDIAGANGYDGKGRYGTEWVSLLVETGVFNSTRMNFVEGDPRKADVINMDVVEAVKWALRNEGWRDE